jgi:prepilin-type N-terminal cleavage/methylation domain-containing protein
MKKGFTLIELMAAIIILSVIALIAVPLVEQTLVNIGKDAYDTQIKSIKASAKQWGANNLYQLPLNDGDQTNLTLDVLKSEGFVKKEIFNPRTKEEFEGTLRIAIINKNGDYLYLVDTEIDDYANPNAPTITVNGSTLTYVDMGSTYSELGVTAKNSAGVVIAANPPVITRNGSVVLSLLTNGLYVYTITYSVTDMVEGQQVTIKTARTVIIRDITPPVLTVNPASATLARTTLTYNIMTGVSATDNSGSSPVIKSSTNLTLGVPGVYKIDYTATDNSGNSTTRQRIITITY